MINPLKTVEVNRFILRHPRVQDAHRGFLVAQVTDPHMGRWVKPRHLRQLVEFVNTQGPDLVALTGDYVGYSKLDLPLCIQSFTGFEAPTYGVLGNHDHWADTDLAIKSFEDADIPLLRNEAVEMPGREGIWVVGVDDLVTGHADVPAAFADVPPDAMSIVLNHVPAAAWECAERGGHLILSGHTHGFQFNIPVITNAIAERFGTKLFAGPYRLGDGVLYISRGLGSASWPRRIRALPELTFFTLETGEIPELELVDHDTITVNHQKT